MMGLAVMWFVFASAFGLVGVIQVADNQKSGFVCMAFCLVCAAAATAVQLYAPEAVINVEPLEVP